MKTFNNSLLPKSLGKVGTQRGTSVATFSPPRRGRTINIDRSLNPAYNKNHRSQIKMFETVGILTIFFFLLVFGASFWYGVEKTTAKQDLSKSIQLRALQVGSRAVYMPELDCSFVGVQKENCFDLTKATIFATRAKDDAAIILYYKVFENSKVTIKEVYPGSASVMIYNNTPKGIFQINTLQSPVLLYNATAKRYGFGILEVSVYATNQ